MIFVLLPLLLPAGSPPVRPAADLSRAESYFRDGMAHTAQFTQSYTPAGFSRPQVESGAVTIQEPDNIRFDYDKPSHKIFTFDGRTARFYTPADKQMMEKELTSEELAQLPLVFLESPQKLSLTYTLSDEEVPDGVSVLLTPKSSGGEVSWVRVRLSSTGVPRTLSYQTSGGDRTEFAFENFRSEAPRGASAFTIVAPAGTRIVGNNEN